MLDLIVNPIAGGKDGKRMIKKLAIIEKRLKERTVSYSVHLGHNFGDVRRITNQLCNSGATDIICVGGDGTLHEVLNGFTNFDKVNLGLIPCGTGNDFAGALKLPLDPEKAIDLILDGKPQYTDYLQLPNVKCMNIAGIGIDVDVLKRYNSLKKKTKLGYTSCLIKTLFDFEYTHFNVDVDGKKQEFTSFIACIANGFTYGGGIPICPPADPTDNKLDFVAVKQIKRLKIIGAFLKLKKGKLLSLKESYHVTGKHVKITTDKPVTVNVDGELYNDLPLDIELISNTLKMYR